MRALAKLRNFLASFQSDPDHLHQADDTIFPDEYDRTLATRHPGDYLQMYDSVLLDSEAQTLLEKRCEAVTEREWGVQASDDDDESHERAIRIADELGRQEFKFDRLCHSLQHDSLLYGIGAVELIWHRTEDGLWFPRGWKALRIDRLRIDAQGNFRIRTRSNQTNGEPAKYGQLIVVRFRDAGGAWPYGRGLGRTLWWLSWFKRQAWVAWLEGAERTGSPAIVGKLPTGMNETEKKTLESALASLSSSDTGVIPKEAEVMLLERKGSKGEIYKMLIDKLDASMAKLVLGATLTTEVGAKGSYAAAGVHDAVGTRRAKADAKYLGEAIGPQLLSIIHDANWGSGNGLPPKLVRDFYEPSKLKEVGGAMQTLAKLGYEPQDKAAYARKRLGSDWTHRDMEQGAPSLAEAKFRQARKRPSEVDRAAIRQMKLLDDLTDAATPEEPWSELADELIEAIEKSESKEDILDAVRALKTKTVSAAWIEDLARGLLAAEMHGRLMVDD